MFCGILSVLNGFVLVGDMVSDGLNVWEYHKLATKKNGDWDDPFNWRFYYNASNRETVREAIYFYFSLGAMVLPLAVAITLFTLFLLKVISRSICNLASECCCNTRCFGLFVSILLFLPITFPVSVSISVFVISISWMISPILHLIYAGLIAGGAKPSGIGSNELNGSLWKKFATLMMFLSFVETCFEALPQTVIGFVIFRDQWNQASLENSEEIWNLFKLMIRYPYQAVSYFFSICCLARTIISISYSTSVDFSNSFFGMVYYFWIGRVEEKESREEKIKRLDSFDADLIIFGFKKGEKVKNAQFLDKMGLKSNLVSDNSFQTDELTRQDKCVLNTMSLQDCLKHMSELEGKCCDGSSLRMECSIHIAKPPSQVANSALVEMGNGQCSQEDEPLLVEERNEKERQKKNLNLSSCFKRDKSDQSDADAEQELQSVHSEKSQEAEVLEDKTESTAAETTESNDIKNGDE